MTNLSGTDLSILGFMNAYSTGRSGGDVAFIEIFKRWPHADRIVVTSEMGSRLCREMGLDCRYILTTREHTWSNVYLTYLLRVLLGCLVAWKVKKVDLIYISSDILPDVIPAFITFAKFTLQGKRPRVVAKSYHINSSKRLLSSLLQKLSLRFISTFADRIITSSVSSRDSIELQGVDSQKIEVNRLGISLKAEAFASNASNYAHSNQVVCLGRIHPAKGIYELIEIWAQVIRSVPDAVLVLIGAGSDEHKLALREKIRELNLGESVKVLGFVADAEKYSTIRSSKALVLPSREEGFSLAILEAFACGVPAVAFRLPVLHELFSPELITADLDGDDFAKKVISLLLSSKRPEEQKPQRLQTKAATFDWETSAREEWNIAFRKTVNIRPLQQTN